MYRIYRKILHSDEGYLKNLEKSGVLEEILWLISGSSLKIRAVSLVTGKGKLCLAYYGKG